MDGACSIHGRDQKCIQNMSQKNEGMRPFGIPRHR
jgi:hypothetical protein